MSEPIMEFKTQEELNACLAEWQERLFLQDWTIKANYDCTSLNGQEIMGNCNYCAVNKCATINLCIPDEDTKSRIQKCCMEGTLVHELLHCKMMLADGSPENTEGKFFNECEHALLEQLAKSFIMVKYGLTFEWFKNF